MRNFGFWVDAGWLLNCLTDLSMRATGAHVVYFYHFLVCGALDAALGRMLNCFVELVFPECFLFFCGSCFKGFGLSGRGLLGVRADMGTGNTWDSP